MFSHARLGLASVSVLMLVAAASAQTALGTLRGVVLDQQGGALPGATITVRQFETNTTATAVTGAGGEYFLPNLRPGHYEITAALSSFAPRKQELDLRVGQELTINLTLNLGGVS